MVRGYAPVPRVSELRQGSLPCTPFGQSEVTLLFDHRRNLVLSKNWSGNMRTRQVCTMGIRTPASQGTPAPEVAVAFTTDPVKLSWGTGGSGLSRFAVEGAAAYATQRCFGVTWIAVGSS